jgi:cytochrome c
MMGRMMGGGGQVPNLKSLEPNMQVKTITYCNDTYRVTTADDKTRHFAGWTGSVSWRLLGS